MKRARPNSAGFHYLSDAELRALAQPLERRIRTLVKQRDAAKARTAEIRAYVQKYQRELVELRRILRKGSHE